GLGRSQSGLAQNHVTDDSPRLLLYTVVYSMRLVAESRTDWDVARRRALVHCASDERRRVPRTFWGSNEPRADAIAPCRATGLHLIQMGVWCASATDVQPRERKTGCAWRDDRESPTELVTKAQLVAKHRHLLSVNRVAWALRCRAVNGLCD